MMPSPAPWNVSRSFDEAPAEQPASDATTSPAVHPPPIIFHGEIAHSPRMLLLLSSCPGSQNIGWLGSLPATGCASIALTQSCLWRDAGFVSVSVLPYVLSVTTTSQKYPP